jgi:hypothetical protein
MAIIIVDNFQVDINNPIDNRFVVGSQSIPSGSPSLYPTPFYAYKEDIIYKYPGLRIWDFNDNVPYVWDGTQWINENTTGALVQDAATGNTGFENYVTKFANNQTLLTASSIYDSGTHVGVGLNATANPDDNSSFGSGNPGQISPVKGFHVAGNIKTNAYFIGNIHADWIVSGTLNLVRIAPPGTPPSSGVYILKNTNGSGSGTSWDLVSNIVPIPQGINLTATTTSGSLSTGNILANTGTGGLNGSNQYTFKPLISTGLQITDSTNEIRIESKVGLTSSTGIPVYSGLNTDNRHVFKNITSGSLDVTTDGDNVKVELYVDVNDKSFYVNSNYNGPEMGTIAKPYKHIESALYAFVGRGTRWNPEWRGRGKIILLSYIAPTFDMTGFWNYKDDNNNGTYINQIKDNDPNSITFGQIINSQINTTGWMSVNHVNIDGQGNTLEYQGTLPSNQPYWISTEKFINSYDSTPSTFINNSWSTQNFYYSAEQTAAQGYTIKNSATQRLNIDLIITIKNITIVSQTHEIAYHLNYGYDLFVPQPISQIKFANCIMYDHGMYRDYKLNFNGVALSDAYVNAGYDTVGGDPTFNGQYIKATNKWNSIQTHFGSEIWIENRIRPTGVGTGFSIPTDKYMIKVEGRNWNNEGFFEMVDCNLIGSSSTMILVKNTSVGFTNLKISRNGSFISYGEDGAYNGLGKDYYNHQIDISWHDPSATYSYSPYSNSSWSVKKAKAWVNRYMPKKNLFYIRVEGDAVPVNGGISTNAWCRVVNLNIENSFATTTWRNNQRNRPALNLQTAPYNTQTWVNDASISQSININYNQTGYFKSQIGGSDALFKMVGNSYFRVEGGYVYGEQANNLIHNSQYANVDFIDCNFDLLECVDIQGPEWNSSDNVAKKGAFKLVTTATLSLSTNRSISLYSSKVNFVIFKSGAPFPTTNVGGNQFYDALRDGKGWASDYIYPYSPDSTINKVSFSSTTPMIPAADTITSGANDLALNTNVGYNSYKLIPGNKYYDAAGKLTVVKVPISPGVNITLPTEFTTSFTTY